MSRKAKRKHNEEPDIPVPDVQEAVGAVCDPAGEQEQEATVADVPQDDQKKELLLQIAELQDRYLRSAAEFDNYRKRTLREKAELIQSAGETLLAQLFPLMDDFQWGLQAMQDASDVGSVREGVQLIYNKFNDFFVRQGVREVEAQGQPFNADIHEALTTVPAPEESQKGKVLEVVQKGYTLNGKIIRFAKVVVGQ